MKEELVRVLMSCVPFNVLEGGYLSRVAAAARVVDYEEGTLVFSQGQKSLNVLFLIVAGQCEEVVKDGGGGETIVSSRRQYDFFGETALLTDRPYAVTVRAAGKLTCLLIPGDIIQELMAGFPAFSGLFSTILSERLRAQYEERAAMRTYGSSPAESPLLRKRVSHLMTRPPVTCRTDEPVSGVAFLMAENRISSVVVVDVEGSPVGLITEKDLVSKVLTRSSWQAEKLVAELVMDDQLVSVKESDFYNQALLKMVRHQVKHLLVMDGDRLRGILTIRDLVKTRSTGSLWVTDKIESSKSLEDLEKIGVEVGSFLNALVAERASVPELFEIITELHDRLTCRVIEFCEDQMVLQGYGPPPVGYCWVNMGSAGRKEQTLRTDQDNAIIYGDGQRENERYFQIMAAMVVEGLVKAGFSWCRGGTMASNSRWCRSLGQWKETVEMWANRADPEDTRSLSELLDFRGIYGNLELARGLWKHVYSTFDRPVRAVHYLAEELQVRVPLNIFGEFATEKSGPRKNEINLKTVCRHIISCVRLFAVTGGITETSTLGRLEAIRLKGVLPEEDIEFVKNSFEFLMMLRIRENLKKVSQGREPDSFINPYRLSKFEQSLVKNAFSAITRLQKLTGSRFRYY